MQFDQALDQREAEAGSVVLAAERAVHLPEWREGLLHMLRRDADPVVRHPNPKAVALQGAADGDLSAGRREFQGIGHEVDENLADLPLVGPEMGQGALDVGFDGQAGGLSLRRYHLEGAFDDVRHIDRFLKQFQLAGFGFRQIQNVVEQGQEMDAAGVDVDGVLAVALVSQLAEHLVADDLGKTDDGVQRGPQLVADHGQKLGLGVCRRFGLVPGFAFALGALRQAAVGDR